jgi:integrase
LELAKALTAAGCRAARPTDKRQEIKDGAAVGLYLVVQPSGHKSFAVRFRSPSGRMAKIVLGPFDPTGEGDGDPVIGAPLTLAGARKLAADLAREKARGKDIAADRRAAKLQSRLRHQERSTNSFGQAVKDFVADHCRKRKTGHDTARALGLLPDGTTLHGSLVERWGDKAIRDISADDIYALIEDARHRGIPGWGVKRAGPSEDRARHLHSAVSSMFAWAHRHRRIASNPCRDVHRPDSSKTRDRVLNEAEIVKFWNACNSVGEPSGSVFRLLLLTGQRLREISDLRYDEINGDTLTLPAERTKNGRAHVVPLSLQAQAIIASVPRVYEDCPYVFTFNGKVPVSGWSKAKVRMDQLVGDVPAWRMHDARRTMATMIAETGIAPPHVIEAILNHVSGSKAGVAGIYNKAIYMSERKIALQRWADHIENLVAGRDDSIIPPGHD